MATAETQDQKTGPLTEEHEEPHEDVPEATYNDLLPSLEAEMPVEVVVTAPRTKKKVKLLFVIRKSISLPDIVEANKYSTSLEKGKMHMDFLNYILKMWDTIIIKQPHFFKQELKQFKKDPTKCALDGMTIQTVLTTVYGAFAADIDEEEIREHSTKNL